MAAQSSVKLTKEQVELGRQVLALVELSSTEDILYAMAAALDQRRANFILAPTDAIRSHEAILGLMKAAVA